jgi:uncharacterized protein (TIGR02118 family)
MTYQMTVLYRRPEDPAAFDDYYASTHAPLAARLPGLSGYTSVRPGPDPAGNDPAEYLVATLLFPDEQAFHDAMASPEGRATAVDLRHFASGGVAMLTGEVTSYL